MSMLERLTSADRVSDGQAAAGFFRLPSEVRTCIYNYVFEENVLHLWRNWVAGQVYCQANCVQADLMLKWAARTPAVHIDVMTSLRTTLTRPDEGDAEYSNFWELVSKLPNLRKLMVKIIGTGRWAHQSRPAAGLENFDLVFLVEGTWFPDDCYLRLQYNGLQWDTFLMDQSHCPAFQGIHPRCRMVGMKSFLHNHPIADDMPTEKELVRWICYFSCSRAYGLPDPDDYDWDEVGETAQHGFPDWESRVQEGRRQMSALVKDYDEGKGREKWDRTSINRVADLIDDNIQRPNRYKWKYPERPSWIKQATDEVR
ncbi:hypothetical protein Purlil1_10211 [Purpureocillium lilacinum]|uniref:Uncharacterized protein n=1 Tax=Purpureocillium lilacinum TaxID=33203 RepID=A0ABR0BNA2_PURLI|nr:hypothetical protein Purlil1_10211 [Purpureocillium lilacinum]